MFYRNLTGLRIREIFLLFQVFFYILIGKLWGQLCCCWQSLRLTLSQGEIRRRDAGGSPGAKPSTEMTQTAKDGGRKSIKQSLINIKTTYFHFTYRKVTVLDLFCVNECVNLTNSAHILCPHESSFLGRASFKTNNLQGSR